LSSIKYYNAYNEALAIIEYMDEEERSKIPEAKIRALREHSNPDYTFNYNPEVSINDQDVSNEAKALIVYLFEKYIATEDQKEVLTRQKQKAIAKDQENKKKNFPVNVFENQASEPVSKEESLVIHTESIFQRIMRFIRNLLFAQ
jgi:hypothetical protein